MNDIVRELAAFCDLELLDVCAAAPEEHDKSCLYRKARAAVAQSRPAPLSFIRRSTLVQGSRK